MTIICFYCGCDTESDYHKNNCLHWKGIPKRIEEEVKSEE